MNARQFAVVTLAAASLVFVTDSQTARTQGPTCFGAEATIVGTDGPDQLTGTEGDDVIVGLGGDDVIAGLGGNDRICGGDGSDTILAGDGDDSVDGGDGLDGIDGGQGNDQLVGGGGIVDLLAFLTAGIAGTTGVRVDLAAGTATGEGNDRFSGFEAVAGSSNADVLLGDVENNFIYPLGGNDTIDGRGGFDIAVFQNAVNADLAAGVANGADGTVTKLLGVEGLVAGSGSSLAGDAHDNLLWTADRIDGRGGDDSIAGSAGDNIIEGGPGNDVIEPRGGNDTVDGGTGDSDTLSFIDAPAGIHGDLSSGVVEGNGTVHEQNVENIAGSQFDDVLVGNDAPNSLYGNGGNDSLSGLGGADFLGGGTGTDSLDGGAGADFCADGESAKSCEALSTVRRTARRVLGGAAAGTPTGSTGIGRLADTLARSRECGTRTCAQRAARVAVAARNFRLLARASSPPLAPAKGDLVDHVLYERTPTCIVARGKSATSIAPPKRIVPVANLQDQAVQWYAKLVRFDGRRQTVLFTTPIAGAVIAGRNVFTPGWPSWHDSANREYAPMKPYRIPRAGRYAWLEYLTIVRTTHSADGLISPHYLQPGSARVSVCVVSR